MYYLINISTDLTPRYAKLRHIVPPQAVPLYRNCVLRFPLLLFSSSFFFLVTSSFGYFSPCLLHDFNKMPGSAFDPGHVLSGWRVGGIDGVIWYLASAVVASEPRLWRLSWDWKKLYFIEKPSRWPTVLLVVPRLEMWHWTGKVGAVMWKQRGAVSRGGNARKSSLHLIVRSTIKSRT